MKIFIYIVLILFQFSSVAQTFRRGTYFTSKKDISFESEIFQFFDNNKFNYVFFTCTGTGFGKGTYSITESDSLVLDFEDCESCLKLVDLTFEKNRSDSLIIQLLIKDYFDDFPAPGANCYLKEEQIGWVTELNGKIDGKISRIDSKRTLTIHYIGSNQIEIPIEPDISKISGTVLLSNIWIYDNSDIMKYKIQERKRNSFKMLRYPPEYTISYGRVSKIKIERKLRKWLGGHYQFFNDNLRESHKE